MLLLPNLFVDMSLLRQRYVVEPGVFKTLDQIEVSIDASRVRVAHKKIVRVLKHKPQ